MLSENRALARWARALLLAAGLAAFDCANTREDPTGGETHFLARCSGDSADCGGDLVCVCELCTLPCSESATCGRFAASTCAVPTAADACGQTTPGYCEVSCATDADCNQLSSSHVCVQGACRSVDVVAPASCAATDVSPNQVVFIGDSFFAASHRITAFLEDAARQSGALLAGERYRDYSSVLDNTLALVGNGIEAQYSAASAESPAKVVIMTGGGADVLLGSCDVIGPDCALLVNAATAARSLLQRMASDGVEDVVYVFYPEPSDATLRAEVDALRPLLESACTDSPVACHWVDLRAAFAGHEATYLDPEGTTPTAEGAQASATAIWSVMEQACVAR
jgi:hypothetical protein